MTRAEELAEIRHNVEAAEDEGWFEYGEDAVSDVRRLLAMMADAEALAEQYRIEADKGLHDYDDLELRAEVLAEALDRYANEAPGWMKHIAIKALARYRGEKHG